MLCWNATASEPPEHSARIYRSLLDRPASPQLFERFFRSWLEQGTVAELANFLETQDDSRAATWIVRAALHEELGRDEEAILALRQARKRDPNAAEPGFRLATLLARNQHFAEAGAILDSLKNQGSNADLVRRAAELRGELWLRQGETERAIQLWREMLAARPDDADLREDAVEWLARERLLAEAVRVARDFAQKSRDPHQRANRQLRLAQLHEEAGEPEAALRIYRALLLDSGQKTWLEAESLARIGTLLRRAGGTRAYVEFLTEIRDSAPNRSAVRRELALAHARQPNKDEAIAEYRALLAISPGDRAIREGFVALLTELGEHQRAVAELERLAAQHPADAELLVLLAQAYHRSQADKKAAETVRRFLAAGEPLEHRYARAISLLEDFRNPEEAEKLVRESLAAFPGSSTAKFAAAEFFYRHFQRNLTLEIWSDLLRTGDRNVILRVGNLALKRGHARFVVDRLAEREAQFQGDRGLLELYVRAGLACGETRRVEAWLRPWVNLCRTPRELETATGFALSFSRVDRSTARLAETLLADPNTTTQDDCLAAVLLQEMNQPHRALQILVGRAARDDDGGTLLALSQLALLRQQMRDFEGAIAALECLIQVPGGNQPSNLQRLADLHAKTGNLAKALTWRQRLKSRLPANPKTWLDEGLMLHRLERKTEAIALFRQAIGRFPDDERFAARLAKWFEADTMWADAEQLYWRLYERAEADTAKRTWASRLYAAAKEQGAGRVTRVLAKMRQRHQQNRGSIAPLLILAEFYRQEGNEAEERAALQRAAQLEPGNVRIALRVSELLAAEADWEGAVAMLERAMSHDPSGQVRRQIPRVLLEAGQGRQALEELLWLADAGKIDADEARDLAAKLFRQVTIPQAARFINAISRRAPDDFRQVYLTGVFARESGDFAGAAEAFGKLLSGDFEAKTESFESTWEALTSLAPPGAAELARWWKARTAATQYRGDAPFGRLFRCGFQIAEFHGKTDEKSMLWLPDTRNRARIWGIEHLTNLLVRADGKIAQSIRVRLKNAGFSAWSLQILEAVQRTRGLPRELSQILAKNLEKPDAAAFWLMLAADGEIAPGANPQAHALTTVLADFPDFAYAAALSMPDPNPEILENLAKNADFVQPGVLRVLAAQKADASLLSELSRGMLELANRDVLAFDALLPVAGRALMENGRPEDLAAILNRSMEVAGQIWREASQPPFDSERLELATPGFAPGAHRLLTKTIPGPPSGFFTPTRTSWLAGQCREHVHRLARNAAHPALRFTILQTADVQPWRAKLPELESRPDLACRALAGELLDPRNGINSLLTAIDSTDEPAQVGRLYELLLVRLGDYELDAIPPAYRARLRSTAKRIVNRERKLGSARHFWINAMHRLGGLGPEIARLQSLPPLSAAKSKPWPRPIDVLLAKADQLSARGDLPGAVCVIRGAVLDHASAIVSCQTPAEPALRERIRLRGEIGNVLAENLRSEANSADTHELARYAAFLEAFADDADGAARIYERILEQSPSDDAIRLRLLGLRQGRGDAGGAQKLAAQLHPKSGIHLAAP